MHQGHVGSRPCVHSLLVPAVVRPPHTEVQLFRRAVTTRFCMDVPCACTLHQAPYMKANGS